MDSLERFTKAMVLAARLTKTELSDDIFVFYRSRLESLGLDHVAAAIEKLVENPKHFPSVGDIKAMLGAAPVSNEDKAREIAERIWNRIGNGGMAWGSNARAQLDAIDKHLGPIGAKVVAMSGGWNYICDTATNAAMTTLKAQWREYAKSILERGPEAFANDRAPDFEKLPVRPSVAELVKRIP